MLTFSHVDVDAALASKITSKLEESHTKRKMVILSERFRYTWYVMLILILHKGSSDLGDNEKVHI